jgi:hypothetical protein
MKPLLSLREAGVRLGKSRRAAERWCKRRLRIEPNLLTRGEGGAWDVRADLLDKLTGAVDASVQAQIDALQRQVNRIEARLDCIGGTT